MKNKKPKHILNILCDNQPFCDPIDLTNDPPVLYTGIAEAKPGDPVTLATGTAYKVSSTCRAQYPNQTVTTVNLTPHKDGQALAKYFDSMKAAVMKVIDDEIADIDAMTQEPGETEIELNVRKTNWKAALRALKIRMKTELFPEV